jgi:hypothetical protein
MKRVTWLLAALGMLVASPAAADWVSREKIRAGWIYAGDGADKLVLFKQHGMNALITSAGDAETFAHWARQAKKAGMHLFGVVSASCNGQRAGMRRCVFGNGYESILPCPLDERYWREVLAALAIRAAKDSTQPDREISGILIDWEMYANEDKGGQIYYTDACYCDHCFAAFLKHKAQPDVCSTIAFRDRVPWLKGHKLLEEYHPFLQAKVKDFASQLRQQVAAVSPDFFVGFYPVPHNWHLKGVAQGLGTPQHPMILWATSTYGGGGPSQIADAWKQQMLAEGIHCYYSGGMLLRFYSAANLSKNIFEIARKTDGYWLFTVHTLCIREDEQNGDYYLSAGSRDDYLKAIKLANSELDRLTAEPKHQTPLKFLPEPVRYRHTGFDVNRYRVPQVLDRSTAGRGQAQAVPPLGLAGSNYLVMMLQSGEEPRLRFDVNRNASGDVWGVSYTVLDPNKTALADGVMPPGEPFSLKFKAAQQGLHTVVLTAGYYGRAVLKSTTAPLGLDVAHGFEANGPAATFYFFVPGRLREFTLAAQGRPETGQVRMKVINPQGQVVVDQPTDQYVRSATLKVATKGESGLWSLRLERMPGQGFQALGLTFDGALQPVVSLTPDHIFTRP